MASKREMGMAKLLEREEVSESRFVPMQLRIEGPEGEELMTVGGLWDRAERRYAGPADTEVVMRLTRAQAKAGKWLADWFSRHAEVRRLRAEGESADRALDLAWADELVPILTALFHGGRRGGKSHLAMVAIAIMALLVPGARMVAVSPQQKDTRELRKILEEQLWPSPWRTWRDKPEYIYTLVNGSTLELITGRRRELKIGPVSLSVYNEAQELAQAPWLDLLGCATDELGLSILCANPARSLGGKWVDEYHELVLEGKSAVKGPSAACGQVVTEPVSGKVFHFDAKKNPHTSSKALRALRGIMDERTFRREIGGEMGLPIGDVVCYAYSDFGNIRRTFVDWVDVTELMTRERFEGAARRVVGTDYDSDPGCTYASGRFFSPDGSLERAVLWVEYCEIVERGDERALSDTLRLMLGEDGRLLHPHDETVIVGDASGKWQAAVRAHHDPESIPSHEMLEALGWRVIRPDPKLLGNPRFEKRVTLSNGCLCSHDGRRRVFFHPRAEAAIKSCKDYPIIRGRAHRRSRHAHPFDAWSYIAWRAWGREHEAQLTLAYHGVPQKSRKPSEVW